MGGGNDTPKAPDYGPLIQAMKQSSDFSFAMSQDQLAWAKKVYADNKKVSNIVIDKALGEMDKQIQDAANARQRYKTIYQPLEEQAAYDAQSFASPQRQEFEAGKAEADVAAQFEAARNTAQQRLESFGVDPSQTRSQALDLGTRVAEAAAQASAGNQARQNTEAIGRQLRDQAINVGRGYPAQISGSTAGGSQSGNQAVNTGLATTASGAQTMGTAPMWQQIGNQGVGEWGNLLNTGFSNSLDAWKANQQSSSGIGSALGAIGGLVTAFVEDGGVIPSPHYAAGGGPIPASASPSGGAIPDDVPAVVDGQGPAQLNAGEFVVPRDVTAWLGEQQLQKIIMKARNDMNGGDKTRPAQPEMKPATPHEGVGAIPMPQAA